MITGKLYDYLKWLAQIVLPGFGALYLALAALWSLPAGNEVAGTVLAVDTFLGILLGISQVAYASGTGAGQIHVNDADGKLTYSLVLDGNPEELAGMNEVRFRVINAPKSSADEKMVRVQGP